MSLFGISTQEREYNCEGKSWEVQRKLKIIYYALIALSDVAGFNIAS